MPVIVFASLALQLVCGFHAVRNGNVYPWLFIIIFAPFIGCLIYFVMIILPEIMQSHAASKVAYDVGKVVDPDREYRARLHEAELVDSADAKLALAEECLKRNDANAAISLLESTLKGPHADDPVLLHALARARFCDQDFRGVHEILDRLRAANPDWQSAAAHLLYARAYEGLGKTEEALSEYHAVIPYFPGVEAKCRRGLLLQRLGHVNEAQSDFKEVVRSVEKLRGQPRYDQKEWYNVARSNLAR
jgi:hypothetical protein